MLPGVSKTALLTLRARAAEHALENGVLDDPLAVEWFSKVSWPDELDDWYQAPRVKELAAFRADHFDLYARRLIGAGFTTVVELGCGLSTRRARLSSEPIRRWIDVDLEPIVALRRAWGITGEMHALDVRDDAWIDTLDADPTTVLLVAEGLLYYLPRDDVDRWFSTLRRRLGGAAVILDVLGEADFEAARRRSESLGTPILWKTDPPFERVMEEFGLETIDGLTPDRIMHDAIDRYWGRFGSGVQKILKMLSRVRMLAAKRSGLVVGRLRPSTIPPRV